jgi:ribonuclease G
MLTEVCPYCEGAGRTKSAITVSLELLRKLENLFSTSREKQVTVEVHPRVAERLRSVDKDVLLEVGQRYRREVQVQEKADFHIEQVVFRSARTDKELKVGRQ